MLDPDTNRLDKRPRTGLLVAASVAAIALVGGLIVVANRDDDAPPADRPDPTVVVTDPAIAGDPEPAPVVVDPDLPTDPEGEVLPPAEQVSAGSAEATCAFGAPAMSADGTGTTLEQTCTFDETAVLPFDATQNIELTVQDARAVAATPGRAVLQCCRQWSALGRVQLRPRRRGALRRRRTRDRRLRGRPGLPHRSGRRQRRRCLRLDARRDAPPTAGSIGIAPPRSRSSVHSPAPDSPSRAQRSPMTRRAPSPATTRRSSPSRPRDSCSSSTRTRAMVKSSTRPVASPTSRRCSATTC